MRSKILFLHVCILISISAVSQAARISTYDEKEWKSASGTLQRDAGKPATSFSQAGNGGARVYFLIEIINVAAIKAKYRMELQVMKKKDGVEEYAYAMETYVPTKAGKVPFISSTFGEGSYVARLINKDNDKEIYAESNFSVAGMEKPNYKKNSTFVFCKSVDDGWNPVGVVKSIKAGSCIQFLYKAKDKIHHTFMIWKIVRLKTDGTEEYVNELQQNAGDDPYRFLATDNVCEFSKPGKYRVYLYDKNTYDSHHGTAEEYYGSGELIVE